MWYVLYTKPKAEKKVAATLEHINIEVYCPIITEIRQWSDRKKKITVPLFRSYVFVRLRPGERHKVFEVPGVIKYLYWLGKPAIARDVEIQAIKDWLEGNDVEQIAVEQLSPGDKIIIKSGVFKNEEAIIREIGPKRVRLILSKLGYTISIKTREVVNSPY